MDSKMSTRSEANMLLPLSSEERRRRQRLKDISRGVASLTRLEQLADLHWRCGNCHRVPDVNAIHNNQKHPRLLQPVFSDVALTLSDFQRLGVGIKKLGGYPARSTDNYGTVSDANCTGLGDSLNSFDLQKHGGESEAHFLKSYVSLGFDGHGSRLPVQRKAMFNEKRVRKDVYKPFPIIQANQSKDLVTERQRFPFYLGEEAKLQPTKSDRQTLANRRHHPVGTTLPNKKQLPTRKQSLVYTCYQSNNGTIPIIHPPATPAEEDAGDAATDNDDFNNPLLSHLLREPTRLILRRVDRLLLSNHNTQRMTASQCDRSKCSTGLDVGAGSLASQHDFQESYPRGTQGCGVQPPQFSHKPSIMKTHRKCRQWLEHQTC